MDGDNQLDDLLEHHRIIRQRLPNTWNAFFARFGKLRPVQRAAILPILKQQNVLVTAPTAGGKTEAVVAPVCERLLTGRWRGLSALLITPTRALVNDLFQRLQDPFQALGLFLGRKTSDHAISETISEQFLITTPESTESLLTFRRDVLTSVRAIIIDEIHLLDGTPRGDQLRMLLCRLQTFLNYVNASAPMELQRIALSATVSDPRRVADAYLGQHAEVISVGGQRKIDARVVVAQGGDETRAQAAIDSADHFEDVRKVLVFVNSRKQVDAGAHFFRHGQFANVPVYGHHGSLSRDEREHTEERFRSDARAICVATMTLEIGIDIGDVDLVVCIDPPYSLSSFLQRIGRGCRRLQGKTRVVCVARDRASELLFEGLVQQAQRGMPSGPVSPFRRSVLVQQSLAYLRQVQKHRRTQNQFGTIFASEVEPAIDCGMIHHVLHDMVSMNLLTCRNQIYWPASEGQAFIESNRIYGNISTSPPETALVDADTGKTVAYVRDLDTPQPGIRVAGRSFEVLGRPSGNQQLVRGGGEHEGSPKYYSRMLPYAYDVGVCLASRLGIPENAIFTFQAGDSLVAMTWLGRLLNLAIAESLKHLGKPTAAASAFALHFTGVTHEDVLDVIGEAVDNLSNHNPLGDAGVETVVDVGPHVNQLSESQRSQARKDWLNSPFLADWLNQRRNIRQLELDTALGEDLQALAAV